jgi:acylphosphatase
MERLEAIVSGRVQNVMYRDFAMRMARRRKLSGEVTNLPDGTVRVIAEGTRPELESLLARLHDGPLLADVKGVEPRWLSATGEYRSFDITYA